MSKSTNTRLSAARKLSLAGVAPAAFASGISLAASASAVSSACGPKPVMTLYRAVRDEYIAGRMAASLPAQSDESEAQRITAARRLLTHYQGFGGTAKLRSGMLGRRTKAQEAAYGAARVAFSGVCKLAGVKVPETRGSDTSKSRKPQPAKKALAKGVANSNKPQLSPKVRTAAEAIKHIEVQAKALAAFVSKNAALDIPSEYGRAIVAFHQAVFKSVND